ncbi:MAG: RNA polymerase sigma factor [Gemmataceae bacterium]
MTDPPQTQASLLVRLRDAQDSEAWRQFVSLYAPLVYRYARRHSLQDADAADVTQEVLRAVNDSLGKFNYDPGRGSFHAWLFTLAHHKLCDFLTRQKRQVLPAGDTAMQDLLQELPAPEEDVWHQEYEKRLFVWAAEQAQGEFKEATWQAFWRTAVEGLAAGKVAEQLGISVGAVYIAKSRVQARIKHLIQDIRT